jgi:hypothetical protein
MSLRLVGGEGLALTLCSVNASQTKYVWLMADEYVKSQRAHMERHVATSVPSTHTHTPAAHCSSDGSDYHSACAEHLRCTLVTSM